MFLNGTASIDYIVASYESSSIIYSSGSTKFGDTLDDTHEFTGSITSTGSFYGMAVSGNFTGSGEGLYDIPSASHAETASYASASVSATSASAARFASNLSLNTEESSGAGHYILFGPNTSGETAIKTDGNFNYVPNNRNFNSN
jgi:6-phosphogluconate dehydrogenase